MQTPMDTFRTVIGTGEANPEDLLHTGSEKDAFSLFAMDVKAEGDFDDVKVCHQAPLVSCGSGTRYSAPCLYTCR